jgi:hypothetical protein
MPDNLALSGGDNGLLNEGKIIGAWEHGLANTPAASILDALDLDPTDASSMQAAIYFFGGVFFTLAVPDAWAQSFETDAVWDAPATPGDQGHAIWWNGVNVEGHYKLQTWGTHGWITPAGVAACDPSCFVVFSLRWFNNKGMAPNGMTYAQLAALWVQFGGNPIPFATRIFESATSFVNEGDGTWLMADFDRMVPRTWCSSRLAIRPTVWSRSTLLRARRSTRG